MCRTKKDPKRRFLGVNFNHEGLLVSLDTRILHQEGLVNPRVEQYVVQP